MNPQATQPEDDPLFGNSITGLLGCAMGTPLPQSQPHMAQQWVPPTLEHIAVLLPQYRIEHLIGRGGMGAVYKGCQITLNRPVAIKILPAELARNHEFVARFHGEARMLASLSHQSIVGIFEFGQTTEGHPFFVMEYVDGMDLHQLIRQSTPDASQALHLTVQICEAMQYAHDMGVIHRDIKPANVLVTRDGKVKLVDFGLASKPTQEFTGERPEPPRPDEFDPADPLNLLAHRLTKPGSAVGTPDYAAPEVYEGRSDARSDIYALGIMLYEMLTGAPPRGYFPLPSTTAGVDERVDGVVVKALAIDPADRYQKASDMKLAVEQATVPLPATPASPARPQALPPAPQKDEGVRRSSKRLADVVIAGFLIVGWGAAYDALHQWAVVKQVRSRVADMWRSVPAAASTSTVPAKPVRKTTQRIEGEAMKVMNVSGGKATPSGNVKELNTAVWSGSSHLWWREGLAGDTLILQLTVDEPGMQRVKALFTVEQDFGIVEAELDGKTVPGSPFDLHAEQTTLAGIVDWGLFDLAAGDHELKLRLVGTHGTSDGFGEFGMGLDYMQLEPPVVPVSTATPNTDLALSALPSASACCTIDNVKAVNNGVETPGESSSDQSLPRHTWHPRRGSMEWAQYEWDRPQAIGECRVFWFDDSSVGGECALPVFWRLLYREESGAWVPVEAPIPPAKDGKWSVVTFPPVKTTALRISVQSALGWSAGIRHWKAIAADPSAIKNSQTQAHPDLLLCDLSPLHAQVGWYLFRANVYGELDSQEGRVVRLGGKDCTQHLWAHAPSRIEFAIPDGYTRFKATGIGPTDEASGMPAWEGNWRYRVEVDNKVVFESELLNTYPHRELPIDIVLPSGSRKLTLITETGNDRRWVHAFWAYPTLSAASQ